MSFELSIEQRIQFLLVAVNKTDPYNPELKHFLPIAKRLYLSVVTRQVECINIHHCKHQMETIIDIIELKLKKQRGYSEITKQVDFTFRSVGGHRITVVEPDQGIREMLKSLLGPMGFDVRLIVGKSNILQKVILQKPDILILDISLPLNSSLELCKSLKLHPATRYIPLIVISPNPALNDKIKEVCGPDVLAMPFHIHEIETRVQIISLQIQDKH